jgi:hypothetical protein
MKTASIKLIEAAFVNKPTNFPPAKREDCYFNPGTLSMRCCTGLFVNVLLLFP